MMLRSLRSPFAFIALCAAALLLLLAGPRAARAQSTPVVAAENPDGDSTFVSYEDGGFAAFGEGPPDTVTPGLGEIPAEGMGARMMWYPAKAAFRAGQVDGTQWDDANVGLFSTATGLRTTASGSVSTAMGIGTTASGSVSTAMGIGTTASGDRSTAMGSVTTASDIVSTAMGFQTTASGGSSTAMGSGTTASGGSSTAMGSGTTAATEASLSVGRSNNANTTSDNTLFVAGNGSSGTPSDALLLDFSGNLTIAGSLTENSDRRLKENIQPLEAGTLGKLGQIRPVRFRFKDEQTHPSGAQLGLIAQEVQAQFPALVKEGSSGYLSVSYSKLAAVLLKGVQEQQAQIAAQREENAALEARVAALEQTMQRDGRVLAGLPGGPLGALLLMTGLLVGGVFAWRRQ